MNQRQTQQEAPAMNQPPERDITEWAELRRAGHTYKQIAARVGRHHSTVWQALNGIVAPVNGVKAQEALKLRAEGKTWRAVAERMGYKDQHVACQIVSRYQKRQLVAQRRGDVQ